jgi:sulfate/thiosulfate transport system substrate-binding protein
MFAGPRAIVGKTLKALGVKRKSWLLGFILIVCFVVGMMQGGSWTDRVATVGCVPARDLPIKKLVVGGTPLTRFFDTYNKHFVEEWKCKTGEALEIETSYAASGDHMRSIIAREFTPDVIALSNPFEMNAVADAGLVHSSWQDEFPYGSSPYYTLLVFAVRSGNPKHITDWGDLTKPGVTISVSDPRICGGGRWVYTGVLGHGNLAGLGKESVSRFYNNVPQLFHDQAVAQRAFVEEGMGDVLVTYESAVLRSIEGGNPMELVAPRRTVQIDLPVAVLSGAVTRGTQEVARAYVSGLYARDAQRLLAGTRLRPRLSVARNETRPFSSLSIFTRTEVFPDNETEYMHFGSGGVFDMLRAD